jgi:hypothetical protein
MILKIKNSDWHSAGVATRWFLMAVGAIGLAAWFASAPFWMALFAGFWLAGIWYAIFKLHTFSSPRLNHAARAGVMARVRRRRPHGIEDASFDPPPPPRKRFFVYNDPDTGEPVYADH